jgi:hypothetical protein
MNSIATKCDLDHESGERGLNESDYINDYNEKQLFDCSKPDVLVLQFGTFEASPSLLRNRLHKISSSIPYAWGKKKELPSMDPDSRFQLSMSLSAKYLIKHLIHSLLGYRLLPTRRLAPEIDAFFHALENSGVKQVIVMSPLPSTDPTLQRYRNQVHMLMKRCATDCTLVWYDASKLRTQHHLYLPDGMHLNRRGHDFLGKEIGELLASIVREEVESGVVSHAA